MSTRAQQRPDLDAMFRFDLGTSSIFESEPGTKPLLATMTLGLKIQTYLWLATAPYEREAAAHKIQVTLPGMVRGQRIHIPQESGRLVLFCGFAEQFDTWILWDAELFLVPEGISYSRNLQVSVGALTEAVTRGISVTSKNVRETAIGPTSATIVSCRRSSLVEAIATRFRLNVARVLVDCG